MISELCLGELGVEDFDLDGKNKPLFCVGVCEIGSDGCLCSEC